MQINCISCASDIPPGRRNGRTQPHFTLFTFHASRFTLSQIKQNKTRSLIKSSYLSKTNLPKSNKRKEKHNKINQNQITFKMAIQRCTELQAAVTSRIERMADAKNFTVTSRLDNVSIIQNT
jgi:hypothetical protein